MQSLQQGLHNNAQAIQSIDFELPEHYYVDLVVEIAKMIGVNLRDADVVNYAAAEKQIEETK